MSLTRRSDFLRLKERGRVVHVTAWLLVNYEPTDTARLRCGWTIPAYVGNAVTRNRLRRWGREFLRRWLQTAEAGVPDRSDRQVGRNQVGLDLNFVFKRGDKSRYKAMSHGEFTDAMERTVTRLGRYLG